MNFWTWNPNHSEQVREILDHATEKEQKQFARLSIVGGLMLSLSFVLAFVPVVGVAASTQMQASMRTLWIVGMASVPMGFVGVVISNSIIRSMVRKTLVSFEWAQAQGITKASLKLDRWG